MSIYNYQLTDSQTKEVVFNISSFENGDNFKNFVQHSCFTILIVQKGNGTIVRDVSTYEFGADCLICLSLYQLSKLDPNDVFEGVAITFHPSFFCLFKHREEVSCNGVLFNNLYDTPVVTLTSPEMDTLTIITCQMKRELEEHDMPDQDILLSYLKIFLINASRTKQEQQKDEASYKELDNPMVAMLKNAIEQYFKEFHSPADYSKLLYVSTPVLNNIAKRYFNKTLTDLIAERIITEGKRQLYLTAKPVKQISFELGYEDEFYFSRFFKKHTGVSPVAFREKVGFDKARVA